MLNDKISLRPDRSGRLLWAEYSLGMRALLPRQENVWVGHLHHRLCMLALTHR